MVDAKMTDKEVKDMVREEWKPRIEEQKTEYMHEWKQATEERSKILRWCDYLETEIMAMPSAVIDIETIKALKNAVGKEVVIEYARSAETEEWYKQNGKSVNDTTILKEFKFDIDRPWSSQILCEGFGRPLICCRNADGIYKMTDKKTEEVLFETDKELVRRMNNREAMDNTRAKVEAFGKKYFPAARRDAISGYDSSIEYNLEKLTNLDSVDKKFDEICDRGFKLIYPERRDDFARRAASDLIDLYEGGTVKNALEVMEHLNSNPEDLAGANKIIDDAGHSGMSYSVTRNIVTLFSKQGLEFREYTSKNSTDDWHKKEEQAETKKQLDEIREQNNKFEEAAKQRDAGGVGTV